MSQVPAPFSKLLLTDPQEKARIRKALDVYFAEYDQAFLKTPAGEADVEAQVAARYNDCVAHVLPWLSRQIDLKGQHLVEIGCDTGSSTAAFVRAGAKVTGYDIHKPSVEAAKRRLKAMNLPAKDL